MLSHQLRFSSVFLIALLLGTAAISAQGQEPKPGQVMGKPAEGVANAELPQTNLQMPYTHGGFFAFAFAPDGETVVGGTGVLKSGNKQAGYKVVGGGEVILWNASTGKIVKTLGQHGATVNWARFSPDGKTLATANLSRLWSDGKTQTPAGLSNDTVKVWDLPSGKLRQTITLPGKVVTSGGFFPRLFLTADGSLVIAAITHEIKAVMVLKLANSDLRAWDTATGKEAWSLVDSQVQTASVSLDGKSLALFQAKFVDLREGENESLKFKLTDQRLSVLDAASGKLGKSIPADRFSPNVVFFLDDGKRIGGADHFGLTSWNLETGRSFAPVSWDRTRRSSTNLVVSADGKTLARAWTDYVELIDMATGRTVGLKKFDLPQPLLHPAFTPDLKRMACSISDPVVFDLTKLAAPPEASSPPAASSDSKR